MKLNRYPLVLAILIAALLLTSCGSAMTTSSWPGLTVSGETAYIASGNWVEAVKVSDGTMAWRYPAKLDARRFFYAAPALSDSLMVVGDYSNTIYGLDPTNGAEKWKFTEAKGRIIGSPLLLGDVVVVPSADHYIYGLDLQGKLLWKFQAKNMNWAAPISDGTHVLIASMDKTLYALDPKTGAKVWATPLGGSVMQAPLLKDNVLYLGTLANEVLAVDSASGSITWRKAVDAAVWATPVEKDGTLYFGDVTGKVYAIASKDGSLAWSLTLGGAILSSPAVSSDALFFPNEDGSLYKVSLKGEKQWGHPVDGKLYASPQQTGDFLLVPISAGTKLLVALDANGNEVWSFVSPK
jgi:outer membrane protein assembly factor BamB